MARKLDIVMTVIEINGEFLPAKGCTKCHEVKPLDDFHRHASGLGGRQYWCKSCFAGHNQSKAEAVALEPIVEEIEEVACVETEAVVEVEETHETDEYGDFPQGEEVTCIMSHMGVKETVDSYLQVSLPLDTPVFPKVEIMGTRFTEDAPVVVYDLFHNTGHLTGEMEICPVLCPNLNRDSLVEYVTNMLKRDFGMI